MSNEVAEMEFLEEDTGFDPRAVNRLAMLRLNNTTGEPQPSMEEPCTICGSVKKRSPPYSSYSLQEPKTLKVNPPSGFSLPPSISNPTLLGCSLLPIDYPGVNVNDGLALDLQFSGYLSNFLSPTTPENLKIGFPAAINPSPMKEAAASASSSLPILLRRTLSDPTPAYLEATTTPPRPPSARKSLQSPSSMGSPNAKRLKRMKDRVKEMKHWCEEIREDVEEENTNNAPQFVAELNGSVSKPVEPAWVERSGESSIIHFKCLCDKGYQILLYGNNIYSMLMPLEQVAKDPSSKEINALELHIRNLLSPSTPFFNTLYGPYRDGADCISDAQLEVQGNSGVTTLYDPSSNSAITLPRERESLQEYWNSWRLVTLKRVVVRLMDETHPRSDVLFIKRNAP